MITIKRATPNDTELIVDIGTRSFRESHGHSAPAADIESYIFRTFETNFVQKELNNPENIYHIIYSENQPAGYSKIIYNKPHPLTACNSVTKLERLYLLKEFYRLQLGLHLFNFVTDLSKKSLQEGIWVFVWIENYRAINFYKKCGFKIIGGIDFKVSETHSNANHVMYLEY